MRLRTGAGRAPSNASPDVCVTGLFSDSPHLGHKHGLRWSTGALSSSSVSFSDSPDLAQASRPQSAFRVCLSSRASVFRRPHFLLISASCLSCSALISGAQQQRLMKNCEHSNFSASRTRVHFRGSSALSLRISSIWSGPRWYFFSYCGRMDCSAFGFRALLCMDVAGVEEDVALVTGASECNFLRGSEDGRNFSGVW